MHHGPSRSKPGPKRLTAHKGRPNADCCADSPGKLPDHGNVKSTGLLSEDRNKRYHDPREPGLDRTGLEVGGSSGPQRLGRGRLTWERDFTNSALDGTIHGAKKHALSEVNGQWHAGLWM